MTDNVGGPTPLWQTSKGLRTSNQDRVLACNGAGTVLVAVADGMGGLQSGDRAAEAAVRSLEEWFGHSPSFAHAALVRAIQEANGAVYQLALESDLVGKTGTTLVACIIQGNRYLVANAGDSRCYYVNDYGARCLTEDHSRVQQLVNDGAMTAEAARQSPFRNELTNSLGEPCDIRVDISPASPCFGVIDEPCVLLVCSDGLHGWVTDVGIFATLHETPNLNSGLERLVEMALANGSSDNVSVAAAEFGGLKRQAAAGRTRAQDGRIASGYYGDKWWIQWRVWAAIGVLALLGGWIWLRGLPWRR